MRETRKNGGVLIPKRVYYAHNMLHYGSNIEHQDIETLQKMGFEVVNPNHPDNEKAYKEHGFSIFTDMVDRCDILAFRSIMGSISAGVGKEINFARAKNMPVIEMPTITTSRFLTVNETIEYCRPLGINEA